MKRWLLLSLRKDNKSLCLLNLVFLCLMLVSYPSSVYAIDGINRFIPTQDPNQKPTRNPTKNPTRNPTQKPTQFPTLKPTRDQNQKPTLQRTEKQQSDDNDKEKVDVLIVGGGWSGVSALEFLAKRGVNVVLLEARDYLGGRSRTVNDFVQGVSTELGSSWVFEDTEIQDLVDKVGVNYGVIDYSSDWSYLGLYESGQFGTDDDEMGWVDDESSTLRRGESKYLLEVEWEKYFIPFSKYTTDFLRVNNLDQSYQDVLDSYIDYWDLPRNNQIRQFINAMVQTQMSLEYVAPLNDLSTAAVGDQVNRCIFCGSNHYMAVPGGGFDKLIAGVSDPYQDRVKLQSPVKKIEYDDDLVRITYEDKQNGTVRTKYADHVLVTVPLGVLKAKSIEFIPPLPRWKQSVIDYIGFGVLNKCILYWEGNGAGKWWPKNKSVVSLITDEDKDSGFWTTFFNDKSLGNDEHFILTGWIGGENAIRSEESQSDNDVLDTVLRNLRSMFGKAVRPPTKYIITRWGQDEYALGSYSYVPVGRRSIDAARVDLGWHIGRGKVYFSGEATDSYYGTVVGARRSGIEKAKKILMRLEARARRKKKRSSSSRDGSDSDIDFNSSH